MRHTTGVAGHWTVLLLVCVMGVTACPETDPVLDGGVADAGQVDLPASDLGVDLPGSDARVDMPLPDMSDTPLPDTAPDTDSPLPDLGVDAPPPEMGADATPQDAKPDQGPPCVHPAVVEKCTGGWCTIPAGCFFMGSPTSEPCRMSSSIPGIPAETRHRVTLTRAFEIQATEVTQGQFKSLMGYNPSWFGPSGPGANCGTNCPVEYVSWFEAAAYCNELSKKAGKAACYACTGKGKSVACSVAKAYGGQDIYNCPGYRLPTEAEWEYAYRAGTKTAYHGGANDPGKCTTCSSLDANADKIGWYCANSGGRTHPVAQKKKNAWGLYDMAGNVGEWCHDWMKLDLGSAAAMDPWGTIWLLSGNDRVIRGGWWFSPPRQMRAAFRWRFSVSKLSNSYLYGFRCARTLGLPSVDAGVAMDAGPGD